MGDRGERGALGAPEPRLPVLTGRVWAFADDLAAEDILPARFATLAPAEAARRLFADLDAGLAARLAPGDVLVGGQNLGWGSGGPAAARALAAAGVIANLSSGDRLPVRNLSEELLQALRARLGR